MATIVSMRAMIRSNKDGTAGEAEEEEDNHDNAYFCFVFFVDVNI